MTSSIMINANKEFCCDEFLVYADIPSLTLYATVPQGWLFVCEGVSTTMFLLQCVKDGYELIVDNLAAYSDLRLFPYLADSVARFLGGCTEDDDKLYSVYDEEWVELVISEEIAMLKGVLSVAPRYYLSLPLSPDAYVTLSAFYEFGVNLHSSTPRIYGYMQYMMQNGVLPAGEMSDDSPSEETVEVDIPQHEPVGSVKSWQLDGSETYETYSREDVEHLLALADEYRSGHRLLHGVVLNDIGTLFHEGVGVAVDGPSAVYWFREAVKRGDTLYAATNLGDLYRKGCGCVAVSLSDALAAYRLSVDPYAHYRIGQAYEEGWTGEKNIDEAMRWYRRAAEEGHHLAIRRISGGNL